jgi:antitoxin component YwqK of YwqJK toxin-antitoxin module
MRWITLNLLFGTTVVFTSCQSRRSPCNDDCIPYVYDCRSYEYDSRPCDYDCRPCEAPVMTESYVHKYGMEVPQNEWSDRGQNGKVVSTLKSGVVVTKNYVDGYLEGETTYTFPHSGAIQKTETFSSGHLIAEREMYSTGSPKRQVEYAPSNKKLVTVWYEDEIPQFREEYVDGKLMEADYYTQNNQVESKIDDGNGFRINRDEFAQIVSKDKFYNGERVVTTLYYPNGAPKEIIPYQNGKITGQRKTFLPGGEPHTLEEWFADRQEGITIVFQNGEKIAEVPYLNGIKSGVEERFKDGRFLVEELNWKNGKKHGPSYSYIGDEMFITWYYEGQEVNKREYDRLINPMSR